MRKLPHVLFPALLIGLALILTPLGRDAHAAQVEVVNLCPGSGLCLGANSGQPVELWADGVRYLRLQGGVVTYLNGATVGTSAISSTTTPMTITRVVAGNGFNTTGIAIVRDNRSTPTNNDSVATAFNLYNAANVSTNVGVVAGRITDVTNGQGGLAFFTKATADSFAAERMFINPTGDVYLNNPLASENLWVSQTAPTITSGFATSPAIAGKNYAFRLTMGTSTQGTSGVVAFNTTYTNVPMVVCRDNTTAAASVIANATATTVTLTYASTVAADKIDCIVQGY